jgi:hypothetical protein
MIESNLLRMVRRSFSLAVPAEGIEPSVLSLPFPFEFCVEVPTVVGCVALFLVSCEFVEEVFGTLSVKLKEMGLGFETSRFCPVIRVCLSSSLLIIVNVYD